jgi:uncharacterized protein YqeY
MRARINEAVKAAMKARDKRRVGTLRMVNAKIKDADIAAGASGKGPVSDAEVAEVLAKMIRQRRESLSIYQKSARKDLAEQEAAEIAIIEEFLPSQMDDAEMEAAVSEAVAEAGASSAKDMGKVMSALKAKYGGRMDFAKASALVRAKLTQS